MLCELYWDEQQNDLLRWICSTLWSLEILPWTIFIGGISTFVQISIRTCRRGDKMFAFEIHTVTFWSYRHLKDMQNYCLVP